ncbi:transposase [Trichonephila clavipes]|nr:transposase [Trichonephila clavipes]
MDSFSQYLTSHSRGIFPDICCLVVWQPLSRPEEDQLVTSGKANGSSPCHPPNRHHGKERARGGKGRSGLPDFHKRILFSDEAHFWLNGYVNKQNYRIWSEANPQVYVETPLHPEKLTVWCALWAGGIIGPYFKNDEGHNVTINGDRYRAMITNFFIPELNNHDVQELWFQQDGATCHTARATIDLLKDTFGDRLISRFGPVNWPPRSCDLTPLDYFLWDYVKSLVYAGKPQTLDHLEDNICRVIADIRPQMLEKFIENWTSRLDYIRASRGSHMPEIIFKM